jgi:hypothetical protein
MIYYNRWPVLIRTAIAEDLKKMENELRSEDAQEVFASHGHTPGQALAYSFADAELAITVIFRGQPVALFGVTPSANPDFASVWLLATCGLSAMWFTFLRLSRGFIALMLGNYKALYNFVDARNTRSVRWLGWCGAKFDEPKPYGAAGLPFLYFTIEKETCHV